MVFGTFLVNELPQTGWVYLGPDIFLCEKAKRGELIQTGNKQILGTAKVDYVCDLDIRGILKRTVITTIGL